MDFINYVSDLTSINEKYLILICRTLISFFILSIIKKIGINVLKHIKDGKKEYNYI